MAPRSKEITLSIKFESTWVRGADDKREDTEVRAQIINLISEYFTSEEGCFFADYMQADSGTQGPEGRSDGYDGPFIKAGRTSIS